MQELDTIYGRVVTPDWPEDIIVRALAEQGEWSFLEQQILARLVRAGDVIWDGGAFLGTFGIGVTQIATELGNAPSRLVAIEPGAELLPCLTRNLQQNVACEHVVLPFALAATEGRVVPSPSETDLTLNHGALGYRMAEDGEGLECRPLWDLRLRHGDYDVLKLDVEGMEFDALKGDFDYVRDRKPVIWAECNEALSSLRLLEGMIAAGYAPLYLAFPAFRRASFRGTAAQTYVMAHEAVLLAARPERLAMLDVTGLGEEVIVKPVTTSWELRQALWTTPRWAEEAWAKASRVELVALMGRLKRGEDLGSFLNDAIAP
jgi:FkbM family methyltransferase